MSSNICGPASMFAQTGRNIPKNDFFKTFGNGVTKNQAIEPQQTKKPVPRGANVGSLNTDEASFFDFEPPTNPGSPYRDQVLDSRCFSMPWGSETDFYPLSPSKSASYSFKDLWAFEYQQQNPSNILTHINPANTRAQYSLATPPNDENDNMIMFALS